MSQRHGRFLMDMKNRCNGVNKMMSRVAFTLAHTCFLLKRRKEVFDYIEESIKAYYEECKQEKDIRHNLSFDYEEIGCSIRVFSQKSFVEYVQDFKETMMNPPKPDGICRYEKCLVFNEDKVQGMKPQVAIYWQDDFYQDIDFKGLHSLRCKQKCSIDYHTQCWKSFKDEEGIGNDRDLLGSDCHTPDCTGFFGQIRIVKDNKEVIYLTIDDDLLNKCNSQRKDKQLDLSLENEQTEQQREGDRDKRKDDDKKDKHNTKEILKPVEKQLVTIGEDGNTFSGTKEKLLTMRKNSKAKESLNMIPNITSGNIEPDKAEPFPSGTNVRYYDEAEVDRKLVEQKRLLRIQYEKMKLERRAGTT